MARVKTTFAALLVAQAAPSVEEYLGGLWESFPPARFLTGLISSDRELAFIWLWVIIETINGVGHPLWSRRGRGYTHGGITAPILLVLAVYLLLQLRDAPPRASLAS